MVDVPPNFGGTIVSTEQPYSTYDELLFVIRWDSGQTTKHYESQFICIGDFERLEDFERNVVSNGINCEKIEGPRGGFRQFRMDLEQGRFIQLHKTHRKLWNWIEGVIKMSGKTIKITKEKH